MKHFQPTMNINLVTLVIILDVKIQRNNFLSLEISCKKMAFESLKHSKRLRLVTILVDFKPFQS
jgi:hypothetical protein